MFQVIVFVFTPDEVGCFFIFQYMVFNLYFCLHFHIFRGNQLVCRVKRLGSRTTNSSRT